MANFNTHITIAAAGAGLASTALFKAGYASAPEALVLTLAGTIGGILPDVDLKYSYPSKIIFSVLGTLIGLLAVFSVQRDVSVVELWVFGLLVFAVIRYLLWGVFHKLTVHRGAIHSVAAGVFFSLATINLSYHILGHDAAFAWFLGFFIFYGFLIHLILDELYSVDFMNHRVKRSFGTALKIVDLRKLPNSCLIVGLSVFLWFLAPESEAFVEALLNPTNRDFFRDDFLPRFEQGFLY